MEIFFFGIPLAIAFAGLIAFSAVQTRHRQDSERLDFLEGCNTAGLGGRFVLILPKGFSSFNLRETYIGELGGYNTVREAIDAARLKENR